MRGANQSERRISRVTFRGRAAYGILHFIMRHIYLLMAIVGVCFVAAGQAAKQQPLAKPPATPAQQQRLSDEELMAKTAQATINGRQVAYAPEAGR
jgi:hypothetical protein